MRPSVEEKCVFAYYHPKAFCILSYLSSIEPCVWFSGTVLRGESADRATCWFFHVKLLNWCRIASLCFVFWPLAIVRLIRLLYLFPSFFPTVAFCWRYVTLWKGKFVYFSFHQHTSLFLLCIRLPVLLLKALFRLNHRFKPTYEVQTNRWSGVGRENRVKVRVVLPMVRC